MISKALKAYVSGWAKSSSEFSQQILRKTQMNFLARSILSTDFCGISVHFSREHTLISTFMAFPIDIPPFF